MIRTRDLFVFVFIFALLMCGIAVTLALDGRTTSHELFLSSLPSPEQEGEVFSAEADEKDIDRQSIIKRLRDALASNAPEVTPEPSVEENETSVSEDDVSAQGSGVTYCAAYDDSEAAVRSWPLKGVSFNSESGVRSVVYAEISERSAASSTVASSSGALALSKTLISLPLHPTPSGTFCIGGSVVGITNTGALMHNDDASFYRGYGAEYLIGYARDGFPIYGYYTGEVDECGGHSHPAGYRYSVSADRDHLLNCYKASPASFEAF